MTQFNSHKITQRTNLHTKLKLMLPEWTKTLVLSPVFFLFTNALFWQLNVFSMQLNDTGLINIVIFLRNVARIVFFSLWVFSCATSAWRLVAQGLQRLIQGFFFIIKRFFEVSPNPGYFSRYFNDNNFNFRQMPPSVKWCFVEGSANAQSGTSTPQK